MAKKRNTKLALASLMAVSAIAPVVASADTNGSVTTEAGTSRSTEAETPSTPTTPYGEIADGKYEVTFDTYNPKTDEGNYTAIMNHLEPKATLVVENGKYFLEVNATEKSHAMIAEYQVLVGDEYVKAETVSGSAEQYPYIVRLPLASLNELTTAKLHVVVPAANMDKWYDFKIAVDKGLDLPEKEATPVTREVPVYVYKDGTNELSIMAGTYLSKTATVTAEGIDLVFPQGQYLKGFEVEGATVALKSEEVVDKNTVKIYTIETTDTEKIYTATVDVKVDVAGVNYDTKHKVQLQFGGKQNPFNDIQKLNNYSAIVNLYNKGIFKESEKFNPYNTTTRYQFSLMLYRALDVKAPATTKFKDIANLDAEAQSAIKALNSVGVIKGVNEETFAPHNKITRAQTAKMIYRLLVSNGYKDQLNTKMPFSDVPTNDAELNKAAAQLNALGIMTGSNGKLNPSSPLTRDQMSKVLNNTLQALEGLK